MQPSALLHAPEPPFTLVLVSPQIPPNTGNVARLCAVTGCKLALIEPLGFSIGDKELKRAGLDYWDKVFLKLFPHWEAYVAESGSARRFLFTARSTLASSDLGQGGGAPASISLWEAQFRPGDHLVFGAEPTGLPTHVLEGDFGQRCTIPMLEERRSLNLSTAVGIAAYEALRQVRATLPTS